MHKTLPTVLLILVFTLLVFGVVMLYSTSYAVYGEKILIQQFKWIVIGGALAAGLRYVDYRKVGPYSHWFLVAVIVLLGYLAGAHLLTKLHLLPQSLANHLPFTEGVKGAFRWLRFGPIRVQPSEFAKIGLILFLANYYKTQSRNVLEFRGGVLLPMGVASFVMLLVLLGGSLSVTVITGGVVVAVAFVAGLRLRYLLPIILGGFIGFAGICFLILLKPLPAEGAAAASLAAATVPGEAAEGAMTDSSTEALNWLVKIIGRERTSRITSWVDPEKSQKGDGYQLWCSYLALGSGGLDGNGFTQSRLKQRYLPESHTDFIMAIVGEELGFLAIFFVILAYCALATTAFWIGRLVPDREGALICVGVAASFGLHAFVNIGVVSGFLPTTGVTAPFISYGGSSMVASWIGIGLLLSVARVSERLMQEQQEQADKDESDQPVLITNLFEGNKKAATAPRHGS